MLRYTSDRIRWSERDVIAMTAIIGAEQAVSRSAPPMASIVRAATKRGVRLDRATRAWLRVERSTRARARSLKTCHDSPPMDVLERAAFPHQRAGLAFCRAMRQAAYLIGDDTGVGKTLLALLWAQRIARSSRTLVLTKNTIKDQWCDAIHEFLGTREVVTVVGGTLKDQARLARNPTGWTIGSWETLPHLGTDYLCSPWGAVIADEAHLIANKDAQRSMIAHRLGKRSTARMALTAHPFTNDPAELFSILKFLHPQIYTSYWTFFHMFVRANPKPFGGFEIIGARRPKLLQWELAPYMLARTKQQVFKHLPRIVHARRTVHLTTRGAREYDRLRKQVFAELDALDGGSKYVPMINDLARVTRLRQYLIDPRLLGAREPSLKYPVVADLLDEIGKPTVVFSEFKEAVLNLGAFLSLKKYNVGYIYGGLGSREVGRRKKQFLAGKWDALLCVAQAGDTGLNLGKYGYLIHLDLPWHPRGLEQREGRVDRPEEGTGKLVPSTAYRVVVADSYEERLEARLMRKHKTFASVFTTADLREIFA